MRTIDADALKDKIINIRCYTKSPVMAAGFVEAKAKALREIEAAPTIEPEVRRGHWMFLEQKSGYLWKCSNCKGNFDQRFSYCPHCGAKMDGGADNG